ncbi:MAG TPA: alpha/beta hydrolase [Chloroflexi bacterium]|nr:alpha/beta hydrolase [Chloroflexota bacterium]
MTSELIAEQPPQPTRKRRWWLWAVVGVLAAVALAAGGFVVWASNPAQPMAQALAALQGDDQVGVVEGKWIVFQPLVNPKTTGYIFYPGGLVDPRAYAPQAHAIAAKGYPVVIVPMPLNLAVFGAGRASEVMAEFPDITRWVIGGHSLGGAMAANFVANHPGAVGGLVFWAAFPAGGDSLADQTELIVYSIYGTLDGLATPEEVLGAAPLLPPGTRFIPIEGGNHAQFGWYGDQNGDNPATISRAEQQKLTVDATVEVLAQVDQ